MDELFQYWPPHEQVTMTIPVYILSAYTLQDHKSPVKLSLREHQAAFVSQISDVLDKEICINIAEKAPSFVKEPIINIVFDEKHDQKGPSQFVARLGNRLTTGEVETLVEKLIATLHYMLSTRKEHEYHIKVFCHLKDSDRLPYITAPFDKAGLKYESDTYDSFELTIVNGPEDK